jgi:uncharacterized FlgJ-related protein
VISLKDEITEILEDNGELMVRYKDNSFECFDTLPKNVVDYITNLQEENRQTKLLKERYQLEKEDYKSRNEKANSKLQTMFDNGNEETILDDLLELDRILNGGDNNE